MINIRKSRRTGFPGSTRLVCIALATSLAHTDDSSAPLRALICDRQKDQLSNVRDLWKPENIGKACNLNHSLEGASTTGTRVERLDPESAQWELVQDLTDSSISGSFLQTLLQNTDFTVFLWILFLTLKKCTSLAPFASLSQ